MQKELYTGYRKKHCLSYEVSCSLTTGLICSVLGPIGGRWPDVTLCKRFGLLSKDFSTNDYEKFLGDKGYQGLPEFITPHKGKQLTNFQIADNEKIGEVRVIIENVFARLKHWQCLKQKFRHSLSLHTIVFKVVCNLVQLDFMCNRPVRQQ
jgi:hypothetical protein